jgi:hypothetical protein
VSASTTRECTEAEVVLLVRGEIDATSPQMWDVTSSYTDTERLVLDPSDVPFIDASGVSVIVPGARTEIVSNAAPTPWRRPGSPAPRCSRLTVYPFPQVRRPSMDRTATPPHS